MDQDRFLTAGLTIFFLIVGLIGGYTNGFGATLDRNSVDLAEIDLDEINSLADVLLIAIQTDKRIQLSDVQIKEIVASLIGLQANLRPQINFNAEYKLENLANNPVGAFYSIRGADLDDRISTRSGSVSIVQQLGPNNQLRGALERTKLGLEVSALQKEQSVISLITSVQEYYHGILKSYSAVELAELALDHARRNLEIAKQKEGENVFTPLDVLREQNALMTAENQWQMAKNGLNISILGLLQLVGLDLEYLPVGQDWTQNMVATHSHDGAVYWDISFAQATEYAWENRGELQMLKKQWEIAQVEYQTAANNRDWTATLNGRYLYDDFVFQSSLDSNQRLMGTIYHSNIQYPEVLELDEDWRDQDWYKDLPDEQRDFFDDLWDELGNVVGGELVSGNQDTPNPWQVSVSVSYRFGDGGVRKADLDRLTLAIEKAQLQYESAREGIYLELYALHQQLVQDWQVYQLHRYQVEEAQETLARMEKMHGYGSLTEKDLMEGRLLVKKATNDLQTAQLTYQTQQTKLAVAMGVGIGELLQGVSSGYWSNTPNVAWRLEL